MINYIRQSRFFRALALGLCLNFLIDTLWTIPALALTSGPGSPEFSSFEPVATTDMVNLFTGDFNYNLPVLEIPGPDGGGYAMSLSYHSGASSEEEASWVGYGWSFNPGAINRNTRGFPDDYAGIPVDQYNKNRINWSASVTNSAGLEFFSKDTSKEISISGGDTSTTTTTSKTNIGGVNLSTSLRFNNYQGFARYNGFGLNAMGLASIGLQQSAQGTTYSANINIGGLFTRKKSTVSTDKPVVDGKKMNAGVEKSLRKVGLSALSQVSSRIGSTYGLYTYSEVVRATAITQYKSASFDWSIGLSVNPTSAPIGVQAGADGNFNLHQTDPLLVQQAYGLMHTQASGGDGQLNDYYLERNNPYQKRDFYLNIPFSNPDNFLVTGEGLSGGFRYYPNENGHFYPNRVRNVTKSQKTGFDLSIGGGVGIGFNFGGGTQRSQVGDWDEKGNTEAYRYDTLGGVFRFNHDLGGSVEYGNADLQTAGLAYNAPIVHPGLSKRVNSTKLSNSSAISYHTEGFVRNNGGARFNIGSTQGTRPGLNDNGVAELSVRNAEGNQYVYGLPVYNRNETRLQFDVKGSDTPDRFRAYKRTGLRKSAGGYRVNVDDNLHTTVVGEIQRVPYATNYLLTQIVTSDYVDVNANGTDSLDFGGWTQFHYQQAYGSSSENANWYRWRTPYAGLQYQQNSLSDQQDDIGSVMTGEKEVYYLGAIETKTHIAFFVTNATDSSRCQALLSRFHLAGKIDPKFLRGSGTLRQDGLGAKLLTDSFDPASSDPAAKGAQRLEYLEKIVLFAKKRPERPLKTTRFQYDYSQVRNLPNHTAANYPAARTQAADQSGKLTLKRVWFEYEGTVSSRISPYEFSYAYKAREEYPAYLQSQYPEETAVSTRYTEAAQNPDYAPHLLDPWGNLQVYGRERKQVMMPWVYQGPLPAQPTPGVDGWRSRLPADPETSYRSFDPAAWQLKQIKLPSGGEILIEYEQKDYASVQNRAPMAMASLLAADETRSGDKYGLSPSYTINTRDLGLDPASANYAADLEEQRQQLLRYFQEEKVHFKFLYAMNARRGAASLENCQSEYITGYAAVDNVLTSQPAGSSESHLKIVLKGESKGNRPAVPQQICYDFYTTQRLGKWNGGDCVTEMESKYHDRVNDRREALLSANLDARLSVVTPLMFQLQKDVLGNMSRYGIPDKAAVGTDLNKPLSYLKLPMIKAKRGGGIRVKRLLIYDPGIETGDASLYGQQYFYQDMQTVNGKTRVISSGVATNEPGDARDENPLVTFLPRKQQSWFSRITAGEDTEQTEGPLGESILPGPEIGHSRVVVQNIHKGKTDTGFTVHEFFTVKDYPFDGIYKGGEGSDLPANSPGVSATNLADNQSRDYSVFPAGLFYFETNQVHTTQGYRFILNAMHGQIRRVATYVGDYRLQVHQSYEPLSLSRFKRVAEQVFQYFEPGEKVKMLQKDGTYRLETPGKEMDLVMEMKSVTDQSRNLNLEIDIFFGWAPPISVVVSGGLGYRYTDQGISTHVTSKVLRYPAMMKQVTSFQDGVTSLTENLAFNPHTGLPVLTRTTDGFDGTRNPTGKWDGSVYSLTLPASWYYPAMGPASQNATHRNQLTAAAGSITTYGSDGNPLRTGGQTWQSHPYRSVLSASAQTFARNWFYRSNDPVGDQIAAEYAMAPLGASQRNELNAIWRPKAGYAYRDDVASAVASGKGAYSGGIISSVPLFADWQSGAPATAAKWVLTSEVTQYSPHGSALEERNLLNIYSAARFGYQNTVPVMVANNTRYTATFFESYEDQAAVSPVTATTAHAGRQCRIITANTMELVPGLRTDAYLKRVGALVKLWVKPAASNATPALSLQISGSTAVVPLLRTAQTGEWALYTAAVLPELLPAAENTPFSVKLLGGKDVWVDDVRFQPRDAQATCYVYDASTLRLLTQFDDQHFGLFYQYNDEGKLVRKLIETERGLKTIQETQYNLPQAQRPQP